VNATFYVSYLFLWALVMLQVVLILGLAQTVYRDRSDEGDSRKAASSYLDMRGREVPALKVADLAGREFSTHQFLGKTTAVLFVSPACPSCAATLDEMAALVHKTAGNVIVVCRSSRERCAQLVEVYDIDVPVIADTEFEISKVFGITTVPTAVLVDEEARIQSYGNPMRGEDLIEIVEADLPPSETGRPSSSPPRNQVSAVNSSEGR